MSTTKAIITLLWQDVEGLRARIEFPDGAPDWPLAVVLAQRPIYISLEPPGETAKQRDTPA